MTGKTNLVELPQLTEDDRAYFARSRCDDSVRKRIIIERAIVRKTAEALIAAGFFVRAHCGESFECNQTQDMAVIMDAIMATDEDKLYVYRTDARGPVIGVYGWAFFVYGNTGWDVMNDNTINLEEVLKPVDEYAEALSAWC